MSPTHADLIHEAMIRPLTATAPMDDTEIIVRPGWWQMITPSLTTGWLNEIISDSLPEADADAILDAAIATYRGRGIQFRWTLMPGATPADLPARLERRGLTPTPTHVMARAIAGTTASVDPSITVHEVDASNVDAFDRVMAAGWQTDVALVAALNRRQLEQRPRRTHMFLATHAGQPAGGAAAMHLDHATYLLGAVVLPAFRRRGIYPALVDARLAHAAARGFVHATSIARATTSAPILARLGFETLAVLDELHG